MKKIFSCFIVLSSLFLLSGCYDSNTNNNVNSNASKLNANINSSSEINISSHKIEEKSEEQLSSFSTNLVGRNTARTRNIGITTSKLNGTIVNNGDTFSFCDTIGDPSPEGGYEQADSFDKDGNTVKTFGGGNCQVSSTLYNAVLAVQGLEIVERHPHSKDVHYVEKNKDAAVSYGSVDFKFKNNTGNAIKIYSNSDLNTVNIRIVKI